MTAPECPVVVIGNPLHQVKHRAWQAAYRPIPVVSHPHVKVPGVKVFKVLIERYEILLGKRKKNEQPQSEALTGCHRAAVVCRRKTKKMKKKKKDCGYSTSWKNKNRKNRTFYADDCYVDQIALLVSCFLKSLFFLCTLRSFRKKKTLQFI